MKQISEERDLYYNQCLRLNETCSEIVVETDNIKRELQFRVQKLE